LANQDPGSLSIAFQRKKPTKVSEERMEREKTPKESEESRGKHWKFRAFIEGWEWESLETPN